MGDKRHRSNTPGGTTTSRKELVSCLGCSRGSLSKDQGPFGTCVVWGLSGALNQTLDLNYKVCLGGSKAVADIINSRDIKNCFREPIYAKGIHVDDLIYKINQMMDDGSLKFPAEVGSDRRKVFINFTIGFEEVSSPSGFTSNRDSDRIALIGALVTGERDRGNGLHTRHCMQVGYYLPRSNAVECMNSWGVTSYSILVPGDPYQTFILGYIITVSNLQVIRNHDSSFESLSMESIFHDRTWFDGEYYKPKTSIRDWRRLRVRSFNVESLEQGRWLRNGTITSADSQYEFYGWKLDYSKTTSNMLQWCSSGEAVRLGSSKEPNEIVEWFRMPSIHWFDGLYEKAGTTVRGRRLVKVAYGKVQFEEDGDWLDVGAIEFVDTYDFCGWKLDMSSSSSSALMWESSEESLARGSSTKVGEVITWVRRD